MRNEIMNINNNNLTLDSRDVAKVIETITTISRLLTIKKFEQLRLF